MSSKGNVVLYCTLLCVFVAGFLTMNKTAWGEGSGSVQLSYKVLESYSDDTTLTMVVRLRVKNTGSTLLDQVSIQVNNSFNASVQASEVYFDQIKSNETVLSTDNLILTIDTDFSEQWPPDANVVWLVNYMDVDGNLVREEIKLQ